jgi:hypothetical protein
MKAVGTDPKVTHAHTHENHTKTRESYPPCSHEVPKWVLQVPILFPNLFSIAPHFLYGWVTANFKKYLKKREFKLDYYYYSYYYLGAGGDCEKKENKRMGFE